MRGLRSGYLVVCAFVICLLCAPAVGAQGPDRQTQGFWALVHSIWAEGSITWAQALAAADAAVSAIEAVGDVPVSAMEQVADSVSADVISLSGADDWLSDRLDVEQAILQYLGSGGPTLETRDGKDYWVWSGDHLAADEILLGTYTVTGSEPLSSMYSRYFIYYTCVPSWGSVGTARIRARLQSTGQNLEESNAALPGGNCRWGAVRYASQSERVFSSGDVIEFYSSRTDSSQDFVAMISKTLEFGNPAYTNVYGTADLVVDGISTWGDGWSEAGLDELWLRPKPSGYVDYDNLYPSGLSHFDYVMTAYCNSEDIETCYLYNGDIGGVWLRDLQRAPITIYNLQYGYTYNITITSPDVDWDQGTEGTWGGLGQVLAALIEAIGSILSVVSSGIVTIVTEIAKVPLRVVESLFSSLAERAVDLLVPTKSISVRVQEVVTVIEQQDTFLSLSDEFASVQSFYAAAGSEPLSVAVPTLSGGTIAMPISLPAGLQSLFHTATGAACYLMLVQYVIARVRGFLHF